MQEYYIFVKRCRKDCGKNKDSLQSRFGMKTEIWTAWILFRKNPKSAWPLDLEWNSNTCVFVSSLRYLFS